MMTDRKREWTAADQHRYESAVALLKELEIKKDGALNDMQVALIDLWTQICNDPNRTPGLRFPDFIFENRDAIREILNRVAT